MLRTVFIALAVSAVVFAQTTIQPEEPTDLLTGSNQQFRKIVKGNLEDQIGQFRTYIERAEDSVPLSYWHDIPLFHDEAQEHYNMVVEIPRGQALKTLMNLSEPLNPIMALVDETGRPVEENVDYIHNYGKIPQTWVSAEEDAEAKLPGSMKPLDVVEISDKTHEIGDVVPVKMLGLLAVEDSDKVDYKLIALDISSTFAEQIQTLEDVETHFPDLLAATRGYFRFYKFPEQVNDILFNGEYQDAAKAKDLIKQKHEAWKQLITSQEVPEGINTENHQEGAAFPADDARLKELIERA